MKERGSGGFVKFSDKVNIEFYDFYKLCYVFVIFMNKNFSRKFFKALKCSPEVHTHSHFTLHLKKIVDEGLDKDLKSYATKNFFFFFF